MKKYEITNSNDIYVFFEVISEAQAETILDVGMFLKRIGAVSRQAKSGEIDSEYLLDALDSKDAPNIPVFNNIYNNTYYSFPEKEYKLGIMLYPEGVFSEEDIMVFLKGISQYISWLLIDYNTYKKYNKHLTIVKSRELSADDKRYELLLLNEN